jgi:hypothetical protein
MRNTTTIDNTVLACACYALGLIIINRVGYFDLTFVLAYTFAFTLCTILLSAPTTDAPTPATTTRKDKDKDKEKAHVHN